MGKRTRTTYQPIRTGDASETKKGRTKRPHAKAPTRTGGFRKEHDTTKGQEKRITHKKNAGT